MLRRNIIDKKQFLFYLIKLMNKKDIKEVLFILFTGFFIAIIIIILNNIGYENNELSNDTLLSFWGSYCCGLFAIVIGYLAIVHSNRNSKNAIDQQYELLKHQYNHYRLNECNQCIINNLEAISITEVNKTLFSIDYNNLPQSKSELLKIQSRIYTCDLNYNFIFALDCHGISDVDRKYCTCWNEAKNIILDIIKLQMSIITRIDINQKDITLKSLKQECLGRLYCLISNSGREEVEAYNKKIKQINDEIKHIESNIKNYNNEIDEMTNRLNNQISDAIHKSSELFNISVLFMKEKEQILSKI